MVQIGPGQAHDLAPAHGRQRRKARRVGIHLAALGLQPGQDAHQLVGRGPPLTQATAANQAKVQQLGARSRHHVARQAFAGIAQHGAQFAQVAVDGVRASALVFAQRGPAQQISHAQARDHQRAQVAFELAQRVVLGAGVQNRPGAGAQFDVTLDQLRHGGLAHARRDGCDAGQQLALDVTRPGGGLRLGGEALGYTGKAFAAYLGSPGAFYLAY